MSHWTLDVGIGYVRFAMILSRSGLIFPCNVGVGAFLLNISDARADGGAFRARLPSAEALARDRFR